jgi:AraC-like DNA-binding protein
VRAVLRRGAARAARGVHAAGPAHLRDPRADGRSHRPAGAAGRRQAEQLREAPTWRRRYALVDHLLLGRLDAGARPSPEVARAWQLLVATAGAVPIARIADDVGWSHKRLASRFLRQIGLTPKKAARLVRFDAVLRRLDEHAPPPWGRLAAEAGYADQAHLVREFREFTGSTPTAFLAAKGEISFKTGAGPRS